MKTAILLALLAPCLSNADEIVWEQRCQNGVCYMVQVVKQTAQPPAAKVEALPMPRAEAPTVAVPPAILVGRFPRATSLAFKVRAEQPVRSLIQRLLRPGFLLKVRCR